MNKPKIVHYCWFGGKELPELEKKCIESWKRFLPDYKFILWNETNFDIHSSKYAEQAYDLKKYAYVSDYARTVALYQYGGTYLDTDMELKEGFRELIESHENVMGFLTSRQIGAGIISLCPKHPLMLKFMEYYQRDFVVDGAVDFCDNTSVLTKYLTEDGLILNKLLTQKTGDIDVFSRDYFYPKKTNDNEFRMTPNTVAIHHGSGSWMTDRQRKRGSNIVWIKVCRPILVGIKGMLIRILGFEKARKLELLVRNKLS